MTGNDPPEIHNDRTLHLSRIVVGDRSGRDLSHGWGLWPISPGYAFLDRYVRPLETAENVTIFSRSETRGLHGGAEEAGVRVRSTDGAFWEVFRFDFVQGDPYTAAEVDAGALVAVISDRFARRFFGSSEAVGKSVPVDGQPHLVSGVVDPGRSRRVSAGTDVMGAGDHDAGQGVASLPPEGRGRIQRRGAGAAAGGPGARTGGIRRRAAAGATGGTGYSAVRPARHRLRGMGARGGLAAARRGRPRMAFGRRRHRAANGTDRRRRRAAGAPAARGCTW